MVPPLRGRPILFITRMITDRIGLHLVLLSLLIEYIYLDLVISYMRLSIVCCCFFFNLFILFLGDLPLKHFSFDFSFPSEILSAALFIFLMMKYIAFNSPFLDSFQILA